MEVQRFTQIVEAYGAEPRRWPAGERAAAETFARENPALVAAPLAEARALDGALDAAGEVRISDLLLARVMARAPKRALQPFERGNAVRPALALAACAVFGVILGLSGGALAPATSQNDDVDAMIAAAFSDPAADIEVFGVEG